MYGGELSEEVGRASWLAVWEAMVEAGRELEGVCGHAWLSCEGVRGSAGGSYDQCARCLEVRHTGGGWGRVGVAEREEF
jgi:hypothetical protein